MGDPSFDPTIVPYYKDPKKVPHILETTHMSPNLNSYYPPLNNPDSSAYIIPYLTPC